MLDYFLSVMSDHSADSKQMSVISEASADSKQIPFVSAVASEAEAHAVLQKGGPTAYL
jgi:hypothetical protein